MSLYWKIRNYYRLKSFNVRNPWTAGNLRESEKILLIFLTCLIAIAITLKYADYIDNARLIQFDRALKAESAELKSSAIIATMLNNGYVRLDGVKTKVDLKFCDAAGRCE